MARTTRVSSSFFRALLHNHRHRCFSSSSDGFTVDICTPFKSHHITPPSQSIETSGEELLRFFRDMFMMRKVELAADQMYKAKLIRGFCHLYDGQEAIIVGMEAALTRKDNIITGYRDHCTYMARGGSAFEVFAELMGRKDGCSLGKGGSMHFYRKRDSFYGGHGIVGAQTSLGAGLAFAQKYEKSQSVSLALFGDGAANQGQLFESLNIAALWSLPIIFICENNHYGMGTPEWRGSKNPEFYKRGDYVPGLKVDGMDALAVKKAILFAKEYALEKGPLMVEMDTYRYHGHSMSDPGSTYRTRDEINEVRANRDPIEKMRKLILDRQVASAEELKSMEKEIKTSVDGALSRAKESVEPNQTELFNNIHVKGLGTKVFGCDRKNTIVMRD